MDRMKNLGFRHEKVLMTYPANPEHPVNPVKMLFIMFLAMAIFTSVEIANAQTPESVCIKCHSGLPGRL
ncbi:MAG TPA: hypothetical protein VF799_00615, partial [Geobacteraceae bacterium]